MQLYIRIVAPNAKAIAHGQGKRRHGKPGVADADHYATDARIPARAEKYDVSTFLLPRASFNVGDYC